MIPVRYRYLYSTVIKSKKLAVIYSGCRLFFFILRVIKIYLLHVPAKIIFY